MYILQYITILLMIIMNTFVFILNSNRLFYIVQFGKDLLITKQTRF